MEKLPFFRPAMARMGKYRMGGYGRNGVYRDKHITFIILTLYAPPLPLFIAGVFCK